MSAAFIGLDLAKPVFQVHGVDAQGKVVVTKRLRRDAVLAFFVNLAPCVSVLQGCAGWRKGRLVSMLRILPSCRIKPTLLAATIFVDRRGSVGHELRQLKLLIFREKELSRWPSIGADRRPPHEANLQGKSTR
jgi:hypothetical protein